jgi:hypothetical protein
MTPMICISRVTIALVILNATDQPGLIIPASFTKSGLPLYLWLVCQPFGEAMLYRVAQFTRTRPIGRSSASFQANIGPGETICGLTEQMLFLKECSNA